MVRLTDGLLMDGSPRAFIANPTSPDPPNPPPWKVRGLGSNLHQNLPWTCGDGCPKFHQDPCKGMDFHYPSTHQQTYRQTFVRPFLCIEDRRIVNKAKQYSLVTHKSFFCLWFLIALESLFSKKHSHVSVKLYFPYQVDILVFLAWKCFEWLWVAVNWAWLFQDLPHNYTIRGLFRSLEGSKKEICFTKRTLWKRFDELFIMKLSTLNANTKQKDKWELLFRNLFYPIIFWLVSQLKAKYLGSLSQFGFGKH